MTELYGIVSLGGTVIGASLNQRGLKGETGATGATGNGIASISKTGSSELVDTYTITYTNGNTATFTVTNGQDGHNPIITASKSGKKTSVFLDGTKIAEIDDGVGIVSIYKTGSSGLDPVVDEYTILYDDDNYTTFTVTNGKKGDKGDPQSPYTSTPEMDGTGSAGSSSNYARGDHVHPSDTTKVDKEVGKGLSANDFTDSLKTKLEGVESGAEVNVQSDWNQSTNTADDYIKNKPDLSVYAPLDSPSLTGTPTAPTATEGTNTTQIATTAFVKTGDDAVKEMIKNTLPTDTASGAIASFPDGSDLFDYLSCIVNIEPVQAGSGTPSPDNVRPITGWTGCEVVVSPTEDAQDGTTYPVSWQTEAGTVYGGTVDLVTGVLTDKMGIATDFSTVNMSLGSVQGGGSYRVRVKFDAKGVDESAVGNIICNVLPTDTAVNNYKKSQSVASSNVNDEFYVYVDGLQTISDYRQWFADNNVVIVYEKTTTTEIQLTGEQIACLLGQNNVWADCGDTSVTYKADVQRWVAKQL